jgi:hypothetical protein
MLEGETMIAALLFSSFALAASGSGDFAVDVAISQAGEPLKHGILEFKSGKCTSKNGPTSRKQDAIVCRAIGDQISREEKTYTVMPWINNPDVPSFVVAYKSAKSSWTRETGVAPDKLPKPREALRELAVKVLETAK